MPSSIAWPSGSFDDVSAPTVWNGTPSRRASWPAAKMRCAPSGLPNVGEPDCIEMVLANDPMRQGAPGLASWVRASPTSASASTWAIVPAAVHGDMAPASVHGVTATAWLLRA